MKYSPIIFMVYSIKVFCVSPIYKKHSEEKNVGINKTYFMTVCSFPCLRATDGSFNCALIWVITTHPIVWTPDQYQPY